MLDNEVQINYTSNKMKCLRNLLQETIMETQTRKFITKFNLVLVVIIVAQIVTGIVSSVLLTNYQRVYIGNVLLPIVILWMVLHEFKKLRFTEFFFKDAMAQLLTISIGVLLNGIVLLSYVINSYELSDSIEAVNKVVYFSFALFLYLKFRQKRSNLSRYALLDKAAENVNEEKDGFTARPYSENNHVYDLSKIKEMAEYYHMNSYAISQVTENKVIIYFFVPGPFFIFWSKNFILDTFYISFDDKGRIAVNIPRKHYLKYEKQITFDLLCSEIMNIFMRYYHEYCKGNKDKFSEIGERAKNTFVKKTLLTGAGLISLLIITIIIAFKFFI